LYILAQENQSTDIVQRLGLRAKAYGIDVKDVVVELIEN